MGEFPILESIAASPPPAGLSVLEVLRWERRRDLARTLLDSHRLFKLISRARAPR